MDYERHRDKIIWSAASFGSVSGFIYGCYEWMNIYNNTNYLQKEDIPSYEIISSGLISAIIFAVVAGALAVSLESILCNKKE